MFKYHLFLLVKLPIAIIAGVRLRSISLESCTTSVKHRWLNQNPFQSIYFAVQAMAAELSTGALVLQFIKQQKSSISMLVVAQQAEFFKKATGRIYFVCNDGAAIENAIKNAVNTNEAQICIMEAVGKNENDDTVAVFKFTWSVKQKNLQ
ncbi:MAG TPA: DUF4442 domain-containing protein [Vicingaceae bacterium]|nr:DUF4442 domain-containing protein [Vicingaceae bacterium]